jgi:hypothetical protein
MPVFVVLLVNILVALTLLFVGSGRRPPRRPGPRAAALGALPLVSAALLAAFVFGEDSYRGGGVSRWDAYRSAGGALGALFAVSVAAMAVAAVLLALFALNGRTAAFRATALATCAAALLLLTPTIVGFAAN